MKYQIEKYSLLIIKKELKKREKIPEENCPIRKPSEHTEKKNTRDTEEYYSELG